MIELDFIEWLVKGAWQLIFINKRWGGFVSLRMVPVIGL
jgi:hypothetical protein